jgi:hypothetical protein
MTTYKVRVTDGHDYADVTVTSDSLIDACGHAIDMVHNFDVILNQSFEGDYDDVYVDQVELDGNGFDVPEQFMQWRDRTIADLQREVTRLKFKCGEQP